MSAESPRRGSKGGGGVVVRPQPVSDKTVMESVVDFFQDVAYNSGSPKPDDKEKIQWAHFEQADPNDICQNPDYQPHTGNIAPLLLIIGYTNGVHIWSIPGSGEAQELLSIRQGPVRLLKLLPNPRPVFGYQDVHPTKRPLVAMCDATSAGQPFCAVKFVSLRSGDEVHNISFKHPVTDIQANDRVLVVAFFERIAVFESCQFKQLFWITSCYQSKGPNVNPLALGSRWLAYADKKLVPVHQSCGGMSGDGGQSYAATVISAAKTLTKGLSMFSETVASSLTGSKPPPPAKIETGKNQDQDKSRPGIVTIIDVQKITSNQVAVQEDMDGEGLIAHFPAHATEPVAAMRFDPSGTLLLTADRLGHNFHVFRVMAHPWSCSLGAVHHLYTLYRGDTTAKVQNIAFSQDSRWVTISSLRGTTHVFPITPYGGPVTVRTHMSQRVVNRASRFHRSAGLEDIGQRSSGRNSPVNISVSPSSSPGRHDHYRHVTAMNQVNNNFNNPRLPPYPHPTTVYPLVQIKHTLSIPGLGPTGSSSAKGKAPTPSPIPPDGSCVACCFGWTRGWVAGSPSMSREKAEEKRAVDSLYVVNWMGAVTEYILEPHPKPGLDKITDDSPLECTDTPRAQWLLTRHLSAPELGSPLPSNNMLILATDAVITQRQSGDLSCQGLGSRQESRESLSSDHSSSRDDQDDHWLAQVEILTHSGPHRRLWMGPQFSFKTFQGSSMTTVLASSSPVLLSHGPDAQAISTMDIVNEDVDLQSLKINPGPRSDPMAMPGGPRSQRVASTGSDFIPSPMTTIEAGSYEQSPNLDGAFPEGGGPVHGGEMAEEQLREQMADAMTEQPAKELRHPSSRELDRGSLETLSTSSGSAGSTTRVGVSYDARSSPPHSIEHVLVFPSGSGSPDYSN